LKILNLQDEREATALKGLYHPNIVRLFRYWEAGPSLDPKSHLLMELMPTYLGKYIEGRLKNMSFSTSQIGKDIMPFSLPVAIDIMEQVAQAVQYLHDRHLSHRDLKPSNILVKKRKKLGLASIDDEGYLDIKLADFGLAKVYNNTSTTQGHTLNTGTRVYGAPEIFGKDLGLERNFLPMADVWSFGMTCAEILSGKKPYADEPNDRTLQRRICKEGLRPTLPKHCPRYLAFCISCCWELRPERRPNFASICKLLRHAKLLSLGVIDLVNSKKFFAHTTRSGYVKSLTEPKSSIGKRYEILCCSLN
jgi:serine/threonine protein kinase